MRDLDDPGRAAVIEPVFEALQPATALMCWIDRAPDPGAVTPGAERTTITSCAADELPAALARGLGDEVIWFRGFPTWHALRALAPAVASHCAGRAQLPVIVVEGAPFDSAPHEQVERTKQGNRRALGDLCSRLGGEPTLLWCADGRGDGALIPPGVARRLQPGLDRQRFNLGLLERAHERELQLRADNDALFELLDQSQRDGTAVVRSLRYRLGTRLVRMGRTLTRKEAVFRPSGAILARRRAVDQWRERLAAPRRRSPAPPRGGGLRVTYALPELRLSGGALAVMQLVNELRLLGVDARVVASRGRRDRRREVFRWRAHLAPTVFADPQALVNGTAETDIVVATHWTTAAWARELVDRGRAREAAYFVQDYEPWFFAEDDAAGRARVQATYGLIAHKIVTSDWLRDLLRRDGYESHTIPLGLDLGFFYPRPLGAGGASARPIVLAMARPRTPRRAFDFVAATLAKVHGAVPDAEIVLFGEQIASLGLPFPYRSEGVVTDQERLARLYSSATVHFDGSDFQAFGLPALEAMACGAVSVLTDAGGVREYARDGENCLLIAPRDVDGAVAAITRVLSDRALAARLRANGLETSREHSLKRQARETLQLLETLVPSARAE